MLNYTKPSNELVFDLINRDNPNLPFKVDSKNVIVEKITQVTPLPSTNQRNTSARLRGVQGSGFRDAITLYYDRINLATIIPWGTNYKSAIVSYTATSIHEALAVILDTYGINFGQADVVNSSLGGSNTPNYQNSRSLTAQPTSPAYYGSTVLTYKRGLPVLDTSITVDTLDAIRHPIDPTLGKKCAHMLTFGIDFTAYKNLLAVDASGLAQWAGLRKILDDLGIPAYDGPLNSNTVADVLTTANPQANKAYDRVVIQTGIDAAGIKGIAYYHYNS